MKSYEDSFLRDEEQFDALVREHIARRSQLRASTSRCGCRIRIRNFRAWWLKHGQPVVTQETMLAWMLHGLQRAKVETIALKVFALDQFMDFLVDKGHLSTNPLRDILAGHRLIGYRGIVRLLKRTGSVAAVIELFDYPFSGPLGSDCVAYLDFLAGLGKRCANHRHHLVRFERFLRKREVKAWEQIDRPLIEQWLREDKPHSGYQRRCCLLVLKDLFRFLIEGMRLIDSPVPPPGPHRRRSLPPRIFSHEEVARILEAAAKLPEHRLMPFRGRTYRMLFLMLYTLGLRISEAVNLRLNDIDFVQHSIIIGKTKFYKGRVLPFGPKFEAALQGYIAEHPLLRGCSRDAFLFQSDSNRTPHLRGDSALRTLRRIVRDLGIETPPETRQPCLHSFRHSFAVHRAEQWLREGANLEVKLPLLAAFMGHVDAAATQVYLTMTPARLQLIGDRFEAAVGRKGDA
jgi:site-specific recombinase XerD